LELDQVMNFLRLLTPPLLATTLLLPAEGLYSKSVVTAQKERAAHSNNAPTRFQYVCPMHEDVKSTKPGKCPKCKMKLEKKQIKEPTASPGQ
jgi:heavy metal-binding protein